MRKGQHVSEESKIKISEALKGIPKSEEHKRKIGKSHEGHPAGNKGMTQKNRGVSIPWNGFGFKKGHNLGVSLSDEIKQKIGLANKGTNNGMYGRRGELSTNWKGGITNINRQIRQSEEFSIWREAVFARDTWTCQICDTRGKTLHPHHINSFAKYPEQRFDVTNGITLCLPCHRKFHHRFGFFCTIEDLNSYLGEECG